MDYGQLGPYTDWSAIVFVDRKVRVWVREGPALTEPRVFTKTLTGSLFSNPFQTLFKPL